MKLSSFLRLSSKTTNPQANPSVVYNLYSLPSFDEGRKCEVLHGSEIQSNKFVVPDKCILFNKLNVRFKRIWRINNNDPNKIASTEFLPLVVDESIVDFHYCYYLLRSDQITDYLTGQNTNTSGSHKRIDPENFFDIEVSLPPLDEQKRIGEVLSNLDKKIDVNTEINHYLEAMIKQLYDYWFVQFDFPDANGNPYKSSGGKMVWNEKLKRELPEDWTAKSINEITECVRGVSYDKTDLLTDGTGVLVLRGNNIQDNKLVYDNNVAFVPEALISQDQFIKKGDIIMTMSSGSKEHIGKCAYFHKDCVHTYGAFLNKYRAKENFSMLLFSFMSSPVFKGTIKNICNGTGINNLTNQNFDSVYMPCPCANVLKQYNAHIEPLFGKIGCLYDEIEMLAIKRDMLLPLLMTGQVSATQLNNDL